MRPSLKNLSAKAHDAAAGSPLPAGQEPPAGDTAPVATTAERGSMRKRARRLARLREVQLRDLGALVVELRRLRRENPELVARKAADLLALDEELHGLRAALGQRETVASVVAAGVAGACRRCDTLMGRDDRFCPHCGLGVEEVYPPVAAQPAMAQPAATDAIAPPAAVGGPRGVEPAAPAEAGAPPRAAEAPARAAAPPPPPPPPPPAPEDTKDDRAPKDRGQTELTATAPPQP